MQLAEIKQKVSPIFRAHGIKHAAVFGSVARQDDKPGSDIDIMVELGKPMGLFAFGQLIYEMEKSLGRKVDLLTDKSVNKFIRPYITPELKTIYEG